MGNSEDDSIEATTPWGKVRANGKLVLILICFLALAGLELYIENRRQIDLASMRMEHKDIAVQMKINNFLISLPVEDRPRLIAPPEIWPMLAQPQSVPELNPNKTPFGPPRKKQGE